MTKPGHRPIALPNHGGDDYSRGSLTLASIEPVQRALVDHSVRAMDANRDEAVPVLAFDVPGRVGRLDPVKFVLPR
jgi:hypothetical protein